MKEISKRFLLVIIGIFSYIITIPITILQVFFFSLYWLSTGINKFEKYEPISIRIFEYIIKL